MFCDLHVILLQCSSDRQAIVSRCSWDYLFAGWTLSNVGTTLEHHMSIGLTNINQTRNNHMRNPKRTLGTPMLKRCSTDCY